MTNNENILSGILTNIQTRFTDFDQLGHLNNAVYLSYVEIARLSSFYDVLKVDGRKYASVVAETNIKYFKQIPIGCPVDVVMNFNKIGNKSMELSFVFVKATNHSVVYSVCTMTQLMFDIKAGQTMVVPDDLRASFEDVKNATGLIYLDRRRSVAV